MTLADIKNHIFKGTKTNASAWGTTFSDMAIAINNALEYVESIIRPFNSEYDFTRFTGSDINTGTLSPKFRSLFHEIVPLMVELDYLGENLLESQNIKAVKFRQLDGTMRRWYAARRYRVATVTIATPGVFTLNNHGFRTNERIILETSGTLPTGLAAETWYYVINAGRNIFQVAATSSGSPIATTVSQSGTHFVGSERRPQITAENYDSCE